MRDLFSFTTANLSKLQCSYQGRQSHTSEGLLVCRQRQAKLKCIALPYYRRTCTSVSCTLRATCLRGTANHRRASIVGRRWKPVLLKALTTKNGNGTLTFAHSNQSTAPLIDLYKVGRPM